MFEIEKGVPLPDRRAGGPKGKSKYPWASMQVGDSFTAASRGPTKTGMQNKTQNSLSASARHWALNSGNRTFRVSTRIIDENTVRCWRVA